MNNERSVHVGTCPGITGEPWASDVRPVAYRENGAENPTTVQAVLSVSTV